MKNRKTKMVSGSSGLPHLSYNQRKKTAIRQKLAEA